jgi:hypothetical protein
MNLSCPRPGSFPAFVKSIDCSWQPNNVLEQSLVVEVAGPHHPRLFPVIDDILADLNGFYDKYLTNAARVLFESSLALTNPWFYTSCTHDRQCLHSACYILQQLQKEAAFPLPTHYWHWG